VRHSLRSVGPVARSVCIGAGLLGAAATGAAAQRTDTVIAEQRQFHRAPRFGVDTIDQYVVYGDSAQLQGTSTSSLTQATDGNVIAVATLRTVVYTTVLHAQTFAPLREHTQAIDDSADVRFAGDRAQGWVDPGNGKARQNIDIALPAKASPFDGAGRALLLQFLPLAEGYTAAVPSFDPFQGQTEWWRMRVVGSETLTYHGGPVACWIVEIGIPASSGHPVHRMWITKSGRLSLRDRNMRARPDGGFVESRLR
jgi:hypothetical protein